MITKDISHIKKVSDDYQRLSSNLSQKYKGQWDDPIHDSFVNYNKQVADSSEFITMVFDSVKNIAESLTDNKDLIADANEVLSEAESL